MNLATLPTLCRHPYCGKTKQDADTRNLALPGARMADRILCNISCTGRFLLVAYDRYNQL